MTNPIPIRLPLIMGGVSNELTEDADIISATESFSFKNISYIIAPTAQIPDDENYRKNVSFAVGNVKLSTLYNKNLCVAAVISERATTSDEFSFSEAIDYYKRKAFSLKEAGADIIIIKCQDNLKEIRLSVLGCKKANLPCFVAVKCDDANDTKEMLPTFLICLQELNIAAFGIISSLPAIEISDIISEITLLSKIPLLFISENPLTEKDAQLLFSSGISILSTYFVSDVDSLYAAIKFYRKPVYKSNNETVILSNQHGVFYLSADQLENSSYLDCTVDMSDELVAVSQSNIDVISVNIVTPDDAYVFSKNEHMANLPVMFRSDNERALSVALLSYSGRAMIDSNCSIDRKIIEKLARKYGAVIY